MLVIFLVTFYLAYLSISHKHAVTKYVSLLLYLVSGLLSLKLYVDFQSSVNWSLFLGKKSSCLLMQKATIKLLFLIK